MRRTTRRDWLGMSAATVAAAAAGGLPFAASLANAAAAAARSAANPPDPLALVHPELRDAARKMLAMAEKFPQLSAATLAEARRGMAGWIQPPLPDVPVVKRIVAGRRGAPDVDIYVVNAKAGAARPAILYTHGGGYVLGSGADDVHGLQEIALALDCVCVSVDYALAPEARWQVSTEQNYAGLKWLYDNAAELGADRSRIALLGGSAGGGHAALLAIRARDRGEVPLVAQVLIYPMLDDRTASSRAVPAHIGSFTWTGAQNRYGWASFLGTRPGTKTVPAAAVPARVASVAGLPPTFIGVGAIDLFVDEDIEYARRLIEAGVPTELLVVPGAFHGFDLIGADTNLGRTFTAAKLNALRRAFAPGGVGVPSA